MIDQETPEEADRLDKLVGDYMPAVVEVPDLPALAGIPIRALGMLVLKDSGFSHKMIAECFDCNPSLPNYYSSRYDPNNEFVLTREQRQAIVVAFARSRKIAAISTVTVAELKALNAKDRLDCAMRLQKLETASETPVSSGKQGASELTALLKSLTESDQPHGQLT